MFRIFGPPGTGKTTTLLNMVDDALGKGVPSTSIAFLAFTRKAAREAKERACARFDLDHEKDLPYFRTLHSLAYSMIGSHNSLMQKEDYNELSQKIGYHLNITSVSDDEDLGTVTSDHPILQLINLARSKKVPLRNLVALVLKELVLAQMRFKVFQAEVGLALFFVGPRAAKQDFLARVCLLHKRTEFFEVVVELAVNRCILGHFHNRALCLLHVGQEFVHARFPLFLLRGPR